jgi:hypothetical protein
MFVTEIVSWDAHPDISDKAMINAVNALLPDLIKCPGFQYQALSKNPQGRWVDIYYWDTAKDAHASNELMGDTQSLSQLMTLIKADTVTIEVLEPQQASCSLSPAFS